jgi:predicted RNA-binding Zn-ribbon protein involved in translation (DUF1610 family)
VESQFFCPNCGESLDSEPTESEFGCRHCGEALVYSSDHKVTLAKPIQTYLESDGQPQSNDSESSGKSEIRVIPQLSPERRKRTAELAIERIASEKRDLRKGIVYGIIFTIFGGIFLLVALLRILFVTSDWLNLVGFGFGFLIMALGIYLTNWFFRSSQSLSEEEEAVGEEVIRSSWR